MTHAITPLPGSLLSGIVALDTENEALLDALPFSVLVIDARTHVVLKANPVARVIAQRALQGLSPKTELIGQPMEILATAFEEKFLRRDLEQVAQTGEPLHDLGVEFRFQSGESRHFDWSVLPQRGQSGEIERLLVLSVDVTERVRAWKVSAEEQRIIELEELNHVAHAIHSAHDWIASLDTLITQIQQRRPCALVAISTYDAQTDTYQALRVSRKIAGIDPEKGPVSAKDTYFSRALREQRVYYLPNVAEIESPWRFAALDENCHAVVHIPLLFEGQAQGALTLWRAAPDSFSPGDIAFFEQLATHAAVALRNAALYRERNQSREEAERRAQREALVNAVSRAVSSTLDPDEVLERVLSEVRRLGDYRRVSITRREDATDGWRVVAAWNATDSPLWPPVGSIQITPPVVKRQELDQGLFCRPDAANDGEVFSEEMKTLGVGSILNVELWIKERCLGVLNLSRAEKNAFSEEECAMLQALAPSVALALHNADIYRSLKQAQEALVRAETLRAVGELANGLAHNINNLLAAVLGYAELIQMELDDPESVCRDAQIIEKAALDGAEIVKRVQRFARQSGEGVQEAVNISDLLREALDLTRFKWHNEAIANGTRIEVARELTPNLIVEGYPAELREVFVNLIRNACDAMPEGGVLTVRCLAQGEEAVAEIVDTGIGMDEATRQRIFEPFFTTKGVERGTGLGLSVSWGLIDRHNGNMEVESAPGKGATLRVRLPLRHLLPTSPALTAKIPLNTRVLLIEDEEAVREAVARGLMQSGATVRTASDAAQALAWLWASEAACDVVVCDHGMVGMTGLELLVQIRDLYPHIRRVMFSGWGAEPPGNADTSVAEQIISKPVTASALIAALRDLLSNNHH